MGSRLDSHVLFHAGFRINTPTILPLQGAFAPTAREPVLVDLLIYRDGVIADTRSSTADSHAFIADLLEWAETEFDLLPHEGSI